MRVYLSGYYGYRNAGDDALAASVIDGIASRSQGATFFVPCIPLVAPQGVAIHWRSPLARWLKGAGRIDTWGKRLRSDCLVFGGGSVFSDLAGTDPLIRRLRLLRSFADRGHQAIALGVGIGPIRSDEGRELARCIVSVLDFVSVRDASSLELARELGAPEAVLAFDPAILLEEADLPDVDVSGGRSKQKILGIAVRQILSEPGKDSTNERALEEKLIDALRASAPQDFVVRLFEFNGHPDTGDAALARRLRAAINDVLPCEIVPYDPNPMAMFKTLGQCDAILAMRLHAAIFAFMTARPLVMLSYHPKCDGFASAVGLDPSRRFDARTFEPEALWQALSDALSEGGSLGFTLSRSAAREMARRNYLWLPGDASNDPEGD